MDGPHGLQVAGAQMRTVRGAAAVKMEAAVVYLKLLVHSEYPKYIMTGFGLTRYG